MPTPSSVRLRRPGASALAASARCTPQRPHFDSELPAASRTASRRSRTAPSRASGTRPRRVLDGLHREAASARAAGGSRGCPSDQRRDLDATAAAIGGVNLGGQESSPRAPVGFGSSIRAFRHRLRIAGAARSHCFAPRLARRSSAFHLSSDGSPSASHPCDAARAPRRPSPGADLGAQCTLHSSSRRTRERLPRPARPRSRPCHERAALRRRLQGARPMIREPSRAVAGLWSRVICTTLAGSTLRPAGHPVGRAPRPPPERAARARLLDVEAYVLVDPGLQLAHAPGLPGASAESPRSGPTAEPRP